MSFGDAFGAFGKGLVSGGSSATMIGKTVKDLNLKNTIGGQLFGDWKTIGGMNYDISKIGDQSGINGTDHTAQTGSVSNNGGDWQHLASFFNFGGDK